MLGMEEETASASRRFVRAHSRSETKSSIVSILSWRGGVERYSRLLTILVFGA